MGGARAGIVVAAALMAGVAAAPKGPAGRTSRAARPHRRSASSSTTRGPRASSVSRPSGWSRCPIDFSAEGVHVRQLVYELRVSWDPPADGRSGARSEGAARAGEGRRPRAASGRRARLSRSEAGLDRAAGNAAARRASATTCLRGRAPDAPIAATASCSTTRATTIGEAADDVQGRMHQHRAAGARAADACGRTPRAATCCGWTRD